MHILFMVMKEGKYGRSKLTSAWINIDDYNFCKEQKLSFAQILRDGIREHRARFSNGLDAKTDTQRIEELKKVIQAMSGFLDKKDLLAEYCENTKPNDNKPSETQQNS